jgi:hypothetical protein
MIPIIPKVVSAIIPPPPWTPPDTAEIMLWKHSGNNYDKVIAWLADEATDRFYVLPFPGNRHLVLNRSSLTPLALYRPRVYTPRRDVVPWMHPIARTHWVPDSLFAAAVELVARKGWTMRSWYSNSRHQDFVNSLGEFVYDLRRMNLPTQPPSYPEIGSLLGRSTATIQCAHNRHQRMLAKASTQPPAQEAAA